MAIDVTRLNAALGVIVEGNGRLERQGLFVDVSGYLTLKYAYELSRGNTNEAQRLDRVRNPLNFISRDVWDIETLFERLDWLRGMSAEGTIRDAKAAMDILARVQSQYRTDYFSQDTAK